MGLNWIPGAPSWSHLPVIYDPIFGCDLSGYKWTRSYNIDAQPICKSVGDSTFCLVGTHRATRGHEYFYVNHEDTALVTRYTIKKDGQESRYKLTQPRVNTFLWNSEWNSEMFSSQPPLSLWYSEQWNYQEGDQFEVLDGPTVAGVNAQVLSDVRTEMKDEIQKSVTDAYYRDSKSLSGGSLSRF